MKRFLLATLLIALSIVAADAQSIFRKPIDKNDIDKVYDIEPISNNAYIVTGISHTLNGNSDFLIAKIDTSGDTLWAKSYASTNDIVGKAIHVTASQNFLVAGLDHDKAFIAKLDDAGNIMWKKTYGKKSFFDDIIESPNGYLAVGTIYNSASGNDVFLVETDINGDTLWTKTYGGIGYDYGYSMIENNNKIIIVGKTQSFGAGGYDLLLIETDNNGTLNFLKYYGGTSDESGNHLIVTKDNSYLITGTTSSFGKGNDDIYLVKTDLVGDTIWTSTAGGSNTDEGMSGYEGPNSMYYVSGNSNSFTTDISFCMAAFNLQGQEQWFKSYETSNYNNHAHKIIPATNNGLILAGYTESKAGYSDMLLIKTRMDGCSPIVPVIKASGISKPGIFCEGKTVTFSLGSSYSSYEWSNGPKTASIKTDSSGKYAVTITDQYGCKETSETYSLMKVPNPMVSISANGPLNYCPGTFDSVRLTATSGYLSYIWNNSASDNMNTYVAKSLGSQKVRVQDTNNCFTTEEVQIKEFKPYEEEKICMVTVDTITNKNLIAWQRTGGKRTAYYNVYKETTQAGVFKKIGKVPFNKTSVFVDYSSNPRTKSDRYRITAVDSCDTESQPSSFHKTMHLTANKGTSGEVNLIWEHYEGFNFSTYKIYRGTTPTNIQLLDSIQSNNFTYSDFTAPSGVSFYQVSVVMPDTCYPTHVRAQTTSGPFSQSLSNIKDYSTSTVSYLHVSPNVQYINSGNDTASFSVYSNLSDWEVTYDASWLNIEKNVADGNVSFISDVNFGDQSRTANIEISGTDVDQYNITVIQSPYSDVPEQITNNDNDLQVYPNPYRDYFNLTYELKTSSHVSIEIYNTLGMKITDVVNDYQYSGSYHYQVNHAKMNSAGLYFVKLRIGNQSELIRIVKF